MIISHSCIKIQRPDPESALSRNARDGGGPGVVLADAGCQSSRCIDHGAAFHSAGETDAVGERRAGAAPGKFSGADL